MLKKSQHTFILHFSSDYQYWPDYKTTPFPTPAFAKDVLKIQNTFKLVLLGKFPERY